VHLEAQALGGCAERVGEGQGQSQATLLPLGRAHRTPWGLSRLSPSSSGAPPGSEHCPGSAGALPDPGCTVGSSSWRQR